MHPAATPNLDATLADLTTLVMRAATVVARMMELEQQAAEAATAGLPAPGTTPANLAEAVAAGQSFDTAATALAQAAPRVERLALAMDRLARAVRRTTALRRRMQAGWPRIADDHPAMVRRQIARDVAETIRRDTDDETAERLFDDLAERLDDPALADDIQTLPVEEIVRRICRDLGLTQAPSPPNPATTPQPPTTPQPATTPATTHPRAGPPPSPRRHPPPNP